MKTQTPLNEIMDRAEKADTVFIDLETEGLISDMGHVFRSTTDKISLPMGAVKKSFAEIEKERGVKVAIIGAPDVHPFLEAYKAVAESKEYIHIYAGRGGGKNHILRNMALACELVDKSTCTMEMSPEQIYNRIKHETLNHAQISLFGSPKIKRECVKDRFRKKALKDYQDKKEREKRLNEAKRFKYPDKRETIFVLDTLGSGMQITSWTSSPEREAYFEQMAKRMDRHLSEAMSKGAYKVLIGNKHKSNE